MLPSTDIRSGERFNSDIAGRPVLLKGTSQTLYPGMKRLKEDAAWTMTHADSLWMVFARR